MADNWFQTEEADPDGGLILRDILNVVWVAPGVYYGGRLVPLIKKSGNGSPPKQGRQQVVRQRPPTPRPRFAGPQGGNPNNRISGILLARSAG